MDEVNIDNGQMKIATRYVTTSLNSTIELFRGNLVPFVDFKGQELAFIAGEGRVFVKWFPQPQIAFELAYDSQQPVMLNEGLPLPVHTSKAVVIETTGDEPKIYTGEMRGQLRQEVVENSGQPLGAFLFSLPNFHLAHQPERQEQVPLSTLKAQIIRWDNWDLSLFPIYQPTTYNGLIDEGGFAITHAGLVQKWDADHTTPIPFSAEEIEPTLQMMRGIFGFARGFRCGPMLPLGFDLKGQLCWQKWEHPPVASWKPVASWFDPSSLKWLAELWPGFVQRWNDDFWSETVRLSLYWYAECNADRNAEGSIILAQTALERLAWMKLVKETPRLTEKQFRGDRADKRLTMLLDVMDIPTDIPVHLPHLKSLAMREGWSDGPTAWIKLRNNIVHPDHDWQPGFLSLNSHVMSELLSLGMWYLELCLLRLFGYSGNYVNRLQRDIHAERIEPVPWYGKA